MCYLWFLFGFSVGGGITYLVVRHKFVIQAIDELRDEVTKYHIRVVDVISKWTKKD